MTDNLWNWLIKTALVLIALGVLGGWWWKNVTHPQAEVARLTPLLAQAKDANKGLALENSALSEQVRTSNITVLALQKNCQMKSDRKRAAAQNVSKSTQAFKTTVMADKTHGAESMNHFYKRLRANE